MKKPVEIIIPGDAEILRDAYETFPKHPLYKDVNKQRREGYIRGQIDLIRYILKQVSRQTNEHFFDELDKIPGDISVAIGKAILEKNDSFKKFDDSPVIQVNDDQEIEKLKRRIEDLEFVLVNTSDVETFASVMKEKELLEDKLSFVNNLKRQKKIS